MTKFIQKSWTEEIVEYSLEFQWRGKGTSGFSFTCDEHGKVDVDAMAEAGRKNYASCLDGTFDVTNKGLREYRHSYRHSAIIRCECCGRKVHLANFTNSCHCGADYNMSGQILAPRYQWGEETGEHWTECV